MLGIQKQNGEYNGTPHAYCKIRAGDILLLYGTGRSIRALDMRRKGIIGEVEHERAVIKQQKMMEEQIAEDGSASEGQD